MNVATFLKVSKQQYALDVYGSAEVEPIEYEEIHLPSRATTGSAGYDFYLPQSIVITDKPVLIYTGIRVHLDKGWMLALFPRSGLGFKYGLCLTNTVGIIDSDYFNAKNEGHIAIKLKADTPVELKAGDRFAQGIILPYGVATNDHILMSQRSGGFGSTGVN